jgi:hypothetical protein
VFGEIPKDLATPEVTTLHLLAVEMEALEWLRLVLPEDVRFEHMSAADVEESTARFVCLAHFRREENHVDAFVAEHARALMQLTCFFPVEHLTVASEIAAYGVRFVPGSAAPLPEKFLAPHPQPPMASVVAVDCIGTNYERMAERARRSPFMVCVCCGQSCARIGSSKTSSCDSVSERWSGSATARADGQLRPTGPGDMS